MSKKAITIEDLARMVQKGFNETAERDQNLERWAKLRFDIIDKELGTIRKQLTGVVYRYEFEKLETRVQELEGLLAVHDKKH